MLAKRNWLYDFRQLPKVVSEPAVLKVVQSLQQQYAKRTSTWTPESNSEWLCRTYLSGKMLLSATLHFNSLQYAKAHNLRVVVNYLRYYSLLSCLRAILLLLPSQEWRSGSLGTLGHEQTINIVSDFIGQFDNEIGAWLGRVSRTEKASRELISYRAPSSGDNNLLMIDGFQNTIELLADIAQMCSEILEVSITKNANHDAFVFLGGYATTLWLQKFDEIEIGDPNDLRRADYLARKQPRPTNLLGIISEGHIEDFFGSWTNESPGGNQFDPDNNWDSIFGFR